MFSSPEMFFLQPKFQNFVLGTSSVGSAPIKRFSSFSLQKQATPRDTRMAPLVNFDFGGEQKEMVVGKRKVTISMPIKTGKDVALTKSKPSPIAVADSPFSQNNHNGFKTNTTPKGAVPFCSTSVIKKLLFWEIRLDERSEELLRTKFVEPESRRIENKWGNVHIQNHLHVLALDISSKPPAVAARLNGRNGVELKQFREHFANLMEQDGKEISFEAISLHQHPSIGVIEVKLPSTFPSAYPRPYITLCRAPTETLKKKLTNKSFGDKTGQIVENICLNPPNLINFYDFCNISN